ncbi:DegV family protein [Conchiformibius steedae]|uniref:DegV family protein n=1 Tax=Conchiformibius steedae TaxID=153493 RepID=UPI0026F22069|nr:DegV family protein [Conchiformibius steedae]
MGKKLVVAMSTSCLDYHPHPHNVRILRLNIELSGKRYIDGLSLKNSDFQSWMLNNPQHLAKTSPPNRLEITKFFLKIMDEGYRQVLFVGMSEALSKTCARVREIIPLFEGKMAIRVFDTRSGTFTEGMMALEADRCFRQGWSMEKTVARLEELRDDCQVIFGVSDLSYLIDNGRLSRVSGFVANLLHLKPLIHVNRDGEAEVAERIMTTVRAMRALSDHVGQALQRGHYSVCTLYSGNLELHRDLEYILETHNQLRHLPAYPLSPVVAAHIGPHAFGVGLIRKLS